MMVTYLDKSGIAGDNRKELVQEYLGGMVIIL